MTSMGRVTGPTTRVSIVEDEALMRGMVEQTLVAEEGLRVVHALPGVQEARLVITPGSTDVALLESTSRTATASPSASSCSAPTPASRSSPPPAARWSSTPTSSSAPSRGLGCRRQLTRAQFQVLGLVAEGLSNHAATERLGINERSVESH